MSDHVEISLSKHSRTLSGVKQIYLFTINLMRRVDARSLARVILLARRYHLTSKSPREMVGSLNLFYLKKKLRESVA